MIGFTVERLDRSARPRIRLVPYTSTEALEARIAPAILGAPPHLPLEDPQVSVTIGTTPVLESGSGLVYTFTRTGDSTTPLPINFTNAGSAIFDTDYTASSSSVAFDFASGSLTIPAGSLTATVTLAPLDDRTVEGSEDAILTVAPGSGYGVTGTGATGRIADNDTAIIEFSGFASSLMEGSTQGMLTRLAITAIGTGTAMLGRAVTVSLTSSGAATGGGVDYTHANSTITYAAGSIHSLAGVSSIFSVNDRLVEGSESADFTLGGLVDGTGGQVTLGSTLTRTLTFTDNDTATLRFTLSSSTALESAGTHQVETTLAISANGTGTIGLGYNLAANLTTSGGSATGNGTDYTLPGSPAVTFLAGAYATSTATQNATVTIVNDSLAESDETVPLGLNIVQNIGTQVSLGGTTHTLTIINNLEAVGVTVGSTPVVESSPTGLVYTFTRAGNTSAALPINFTKSGSAAFNSDFTVLSTAIFDYAAGTLTIPAGSASATLTLVPVNDRAVEGSETAVLTVAAGSGYAPAGSPATGAISDNDFAMIRYLNATSSTSEGAGSLTLDFRLDFSVSGTGPLSLDRDVTFAVTAEAGGTATAGADYTLPASLTYTAGSLNGATRQATLTLTDDALVEGTETANLGLTIVSDGTGGRTNIATGGFGDHAVTIADNDPPMVSVAIGSTPAMENSLSGLVYTFTRTGSTSAALPINFTKGGSAAFNGDFTAASGAIFNYAAGTLTIPAGSASATLTLVPVDDRAVEGSETAVLTVAAGSGYLLGGSPATGTIADNDFAMIRYLNATSTSSEAAGSLILNFRLDFSVSGTGPVSLDQDVTFAVIAAGGSASAGADYTLPAHLTYNAGSLNGATRQAILTITDDVLDEGTETAYLGLTVVSDGTGGRANIATGGFGEHTVTLADNDATVSVTTSTTPILESDPTGRAFTFTRSGDPSAQLLIHLSAGGSASLVGDYTLTGATAFSTQTGIGTLTFAPGSNTATVTVTALNDVLVEGDEAVVLFVQSGLGYRGGNSPAVATIADNDTATITFVEPGTTAPEATSPHLVGVKLTTVGNGVEGAGSLQNEIGVFVSVLGGGTATGGATDFAYSQQRLTFRAGDDGSIKNVTTTIVDDTISEEGETFRLGLSATVPTIPGTIAVAGTPHVVTIADNDIDLKVTSTGPSGPAVAGSGQANLSFTITVENNGFTDATNVSLLESFTLPAGVTLASATPSFGVFLGQNTGGSWELSTLAKGAVATLTVSFTAAPSTSHGAIAVISSSAEGADQTLSETSFEMSTALGTIVRQSDLELVQTQSPGPVGPGAQLTYTIVVSNTGPSDHTSARIADMFPAGFFGATWTAAFAPGGVGAPSGQGNIQETVSLPAGGSITYTVSGTVTGSSNTSLVNTASLTSSEDTDPANNSDSESTFLHGADLQLTKAANPATATPGAVIKYTLTYRNGGFATADGVTLRDLIPAQTVFDLAQSTAGWQDAAGNLLADGATAGTTAVFPLGSLPVSEAGASVVLAVRVNATVAAGIESIANQASIADSGTGAPDFEPNNNLASIRTTLNAAPDLTLTVTPDKAVIVRGQTLQYTYAYANAGTQDATGAIITATVPKGTQANPANLDHGWVQTGPDTFDFPIASLPAGAAPGTVIFTVDVNPTRTLGLKKITSSATLDDAGVNGPDPTPASNTATSAATLYEGILAFASSRFGDKPGPLVPTVRILDITTGQEAPVLKPYGNSNQQGVRVAVGDVNGDGFLDIVTSTRSGTGRIRIFDGLTHEPINIGASAELSAFTGKERGVFLAVGDLNGDGRAEIIAGSGQGGGKVKIFEAMTGTLLATETPFGADYRGGIRVANGDVDGDGRANLIAGQASQGSQVAVFFEGPSGRTVSTFSAGSGKLREGVHLAVADTTGDGLAEILVGRGALGNRGPGASVGIFQLNSSPLPPTPTFTEIKTFSLPGPGFQRATRVSAVDLNFDGIAEVIAGAGPEGTGKVRALDGATGAELTQIQDYPAARQTGVFAAAGAPL